MRSDMNKRGEAVAGSEPANTSVRYEAQDVHAETILRYLLALLLTLIAAQLLVWAVYRGLAHRAVRVVPLPWPLRQAVERVLPPEPRLQGAPGHETLPQEDFRRIRDEAEAVLNSYGWVDEEAGIARIPITEAMRLLAEKRLGERTIGIPLETSEKAASRNEASNP